MKKDLSYYRKKVYSTAWRFPIYGGCIYAYESSKQSGTYLLKLAVLVVLNKIGNRLDSIHRPEIRDGEKEKREQQIEFIKQQS